MELDLTTFAGVSAAGTFLVGVAKHFAGKLVEGREAILALVLGAVLAIVSKMAGLGFANYGWVDLIITGLAAGVSSGLIHDKILNPVKDLGAKPPPAE